MTDDEYVQIMVKNRNYKGEPTLLNIKQTIKFISSNNSEITCQNWKIIKMPTDTYFQLKESQLYKDFYDVHYQVEERKTIQCSVPEYPEYILNPYELYTVKNV